MVRKQTTEAKPQDEVVCRPVEVVDWLSGPANPEVRLLQRTIGALIGSGLISRQQADAAYKLARGF